mmetsp:Transcript_11484/g.17277  ORF Transcript_11484/g.17277 Transcript_11484/m.17277 type:complete len:115 (+) Transcript_11484:901-1245(+)
MVEHIGITPDDIKMDEPGQEAFTKIYKSINVLLAEQRRKMSQVSMSKSPLYSYIHIPEKPSAAAEDMFKIEDEIEDALLRRQKQAEDRQKNKTLVNSFIFEKTGKYLKEGEVEF